MDFNPTEIGKKYVYYHISTATIDIESKPKGLENQSSSSGLTVNILNHKQSCVFEWIKIIEQNNY